MKDDAPHTNHTVDLPRYRVIQKGVTVNISVTDFQGLVTHHPGDNAGARVLNGIVVGGEAGRTHAMVGAEIQEIEVCTAAKTFDLAHDQVLIKKDFILENSIIDAGRVGVRDVDVPSPLAGYVGRRHDAQGLVDIYDREGGEVIARVRHMDPVLVKVGDTIEYGQALGMQNNQATRPIHVHMEVDTRYYQHYENYMDDLVSGRLSIDLDRRTRGIEPRQIRDDQTIRIGDSAEIVRLVQQRLNAAGFRDSTGGNLAEDGVYRLSMQPAVINYQEAHGLPRTGDIDPVTLQQIAPRILPPEVNGSEEQGIRLPRPPYLNIHGALMPSDDPLLQQAEAAVRRLDAALGRQYDDLSACMAASAACLAKTNGMSRVDHIALNEGSGVVGKGETLFVVQGALDDPANHWAHMKTSAAVATPVAESLQRMNLAGLDQAASVNAAHQETQRHARTM